MITITYFGVLQDELQVREESLEWQTGTTDELLAQLRGRNETWTNALAGGKVFRVVVNEEICFGSVEIHKGDHIALLPPVTGG